MFNKMVAEYCARVLFQKRELREIAGGGAKRIVRFWEGKTYYRARHPKPPLEASESGICLVCARFL